MNFFLTGSSNSRDVHGIHGVHATTLETFSVHKSKEKVCVNMDHWIWPLKNSRRVTKLTRICLLLLFVVTLHY